MTATSISRKRSHDDLDDGDECLPISKRINSLHIEGQVQAVGHQQVPLHNQLNPFNGFCEDIAATSSPLTMNQNNVMYGQYHATRCLDLAGQSSASSMIPALCGHVPVSNDASDVRNSALNINTGLPVSDSQMVPGQMIYPLQDGTGALPGQYDLYHQSVLHNHLPLRTFPNLAHSSSLSQDDMGIANQNITYSAANPMGAIASLEKCDKFNKQQIPRGPYEPELGVSENPHYFAANRLLYEAHLSRVQRTNSCPFVS